jgi:hypothetical protein
MHLSSLSRESGEASISRRVALGWSPATLANYYTYPHALMPLVLCLTLRINRPARNTQGYHNNSALRAQVHAFVRRGCWLVNLSQEALGSLSHFESSVLSFLGARIDAAHLYLRQLSKIYLRIPA